MTVGTREQMADEVITRKKCDKPGCETPYDDVKRLVSDLEGDGSVVIDLCRHDREPILAVRRWAHKKVREPKIKVVEPSEVRRGS